jgi:hypothetical protein
VAIVPARAGAEEPHAAIAEPPPPPEPRKHWYGAETLVSDGVSAALLAGGLLDTAGPYFIGASALGYSLGAPVIHFAHRRPVEGFTSFVLRVPAPLLVGGGTALAYCSRVGGEYCGVAGLPPALTLMAVAVVIDAVFLSHEVERAEPPRPYAAVPLRITPTLAITQRQALLGVAVTL